MYELPEFNSSQAASKLIKAVRNKIFWGVFFLFFAGALLGGIISAATFYFFPVGFNQLVKTLPANFLGSFQNDDPESYESYLAYEQAIIEAAKKVSPSVVSIVISKNVPIYEQEFFNPFGPGSPYGFQFPQYVQRGTEFQQVGAGSGFIVSADGLVLTNKHVVNDAQATYAVYTSDGKKYEAKVLALDPLQDLALLRIQSSESFPAVTLGDSSGVQIGQTVIAIGNALGQFSNSVSMGIVSGLGRTVEASNQSGSFSEILEGIIQTDAGINQGNSGGPLVDLRGNVIGINTAIAEGAENIGFAIPINIAKRDIEQVIATNKITYPFLGVRYVLVDQDVKEEHSLPVDYGAYVLGANGQPGVTADSAAEKAGIKERDIIIEINGERITKARSLASIMQNYSPGDGITLKILRGGSTIDLRVTLGERS